VLGIVIAAFAARSVALAGFGLDSVIEIVASVVVVWQLTGASEARERKAIRLIGIAFFLLALYILGQFAYTLGTRTRTGTSTLSIGWLAATFLAMLLLAYGKRVTGNACHERHRGRRSFRGRRGAGNLDRLSAQRLPGPRSSCAVHTLRAYPTRLDLADPGGIRGAPSGASTPADGCVP
jgi:hypothetical protein